MKSIKQDTKPSLWILSNPKEDPTNGYLTRTVDDFILHHLVALSKPPVANPSGSAVRTLDRKGQKFIYLSDEELVSVDTSLTANKEKLHKLDCKLSEFGEVANINIDHKSKWIYIISKEGTTSFTISKRTLKKKKARVMLTLKNLGIQIQESAAWVAEKNMLLFSGQKGDEHFLIRYQPKKKSLDFTTVQDINLTRWNYDNATNSIFGINTWSNSEEETCYNFVNVDLKTGAVIDKHSLPELNGKAIIDTTIDSVNRRYILLYKDNNKRFFRAIDLASAKEIATEEIPPLYSGDTFGLEVVHYPVE